MYLLAVRAALSAREVLAPALDVVLESYAQVLFSRSRWVGGLLLAATALLPGRAAAGLAAVAVAAAVPRLVGLSPDLTRSGLFGYNALLLGLGAAAYLEPSAGMALALLGAVACSVLVTAAVHSALGSAFGLPALTLPFLIVFYALLGAAPELGLAFSPAPVLPTAAHGYLISLGALFFDPRAVTGAVIALALLVHSRIGLLLTLVGWAVASLIAAQVPAADPVFRTVLGLNGMMTALALGGVFFVPSAASFAFAAAGAAVASLVALGLSPLLPVVYTPAPIIPFNVATIMLLYAMRQRIRDRHPKSVDFIPGTPEENLSYYRTRIARFGARYAVRIGAPFRGRWVCTQGVDGPHTHRGPWRHGLDFEVEGPDGRLFSGEGRRREDHCCYRLPVVAAADGTVARVVDGVADNALGEVDLEHNWGNLVVLYHGPGLYSVVAHLSPGTIRVAEGQHVRRGEELGRCGSSGRAPRPHLHFQLQATARIGAPTLPIELHDVVTVGEDGPRLHACRVPREGEALRNLEPKPEVARLLEPRFGEVIGLSDDDGRVERIEADVDLLGGLVLRSRDLSAAMFYDHQPQHFTAFDTVGDRRSALGLVQMALGRVPFEGETGLRWTDAMPARRALPTGLSLLYDLVAPFVGDRGVELHLRAEWRDEAFVVTGRSAASDRAGRPLVATRAVLAPGQAFSEVEVTIRGRTRRVRRVRVNGDQEKP